MDRGLHRSPACSRHASHVCILHAARTEDVTVSKVLSSQIADGDEHSMVHLPYGYGPLSPMDPHALAEVGGEAGAESGAGESKPDSNGGEADDELAHVEVFLLKRGAPCAPCPNLY